MIETAHLTRRLRWFAGLLVLLASVAAASGQQLGNGASAATFQGSEIVSLYPLGDMAAVLQARYGKVVTYEHPVLEWSGDFVPRGDGAVPAPAARSLSVPAGLSPAETPILDAAAVGRALDAYRQRNDFPRFRVVESRVGLHIVPETIRDVNGEPVPAKNPLDSIVNIPAAARTASSNLKSICDAVTQSVGMRVNCLTTGFGGDGDWYERLFAAPGGNLGDASFGGQHTGGSIAWGAASVSARDALDDLLGRSATTFSWAFSCQGAARPADRVCWLILTRVGSLAYDRCPQCAPPARGPAGPPQGPGVRRIR